MTQVTVTPAQQVLPVQKRNGNAPYQTTWSYRTIREGKMKRRFNRHEVAFRF